MTEDILDRAQGLLDFPGGEFDEEYGCDISNVIMELIAEVERLRSIINTSCKPETYDCPQGIKCPYRQHEIDTWIADRDNWITRYEAVREEKDARIADQEAYIERLEAAFLDSLAARLYYEHYPGVSDAYSWHDYPEDACHCMPKEKFREKAREALEKIKAETGSGDHVVGANQLILTAEQREEEGKRDA